MVTLLDNTVLTNFALADAILLIRRTLGDSVAVVEEVLAEFEAGIALGRLPPTDLSWLAVHKMTGVEILLFQDLRARLGAGEAASLAVVAMRGGMVFTDDRVARKAAAQLQVSVSSTLGLLILAVDRTLVFLDEADALLAKMINSGFHSPVISLSKLVRR